MARKKIEIEAGAIRPISRPLWAAADEKLQEAEEAIQLMDIAPDRNQFEAGWARFVDSLEEFWTRFYDEGKTTFSNFQPWAGPIVAKRKSEPLLQYLNQARHQSQHGRISMKWSEPVLLIAPNFNGYVQSFKVHSDRTYEMESTPLRPDAPEAKVVQSPGRPILPVIKNKKSNQLFLPPDEFDGVKLTGATPAEISRAGLAFYAGVLARAFAKFKA